MPSVSVVARPDVPAQPPSVSKARVGNKAGSKFFMAMGAKVRTKKVENAEH